jgi:hypothetical protein
MLGRIAGDVVIAGAAAATSIGANKYAKKHGGEWYDKIMSAIGVI